MLSMRSIKKYDDALKCRRFTRSVWIVAHIFSAITPRPLHPILSHYSMQKIKRWTNNIICYSFLQNFTVYYVNIRLIRTSSVGNDSQFFFSLRKIYRWKSSDRWICKSGSLAYIHCRFGSNTSVKKIWWNMEDDGRKHEFASIHW